MSNTDKTTVIPVAAPAADETVVVEKQSFLAKSKNFVKSHKRPAIAVGALTALVGVSALIGRKTAPTTDYILALEPAPADEDDTEVLSESDTTVA